MGAALPFTVLGEIEGGVEVRHGGFGSAAVAHPSLPFHFYALTDRGPNANFKGPEGEGKSFPFPSFTPTIGLFRVMVSEDNATAPSVELVSTIELKNPQGEPITGLPNGPGEGTTGEVPYSADGSTVLPTDAYGLDAEGLVAVEGEDGGVSFWVSDEYGPHIVHFDANGTEVERVSPMGVNADSGDRKIPAVFERRRPNRGMEGLALTPSTNTLVGIMQSTLYNPSKAAVMNPTLTRILTFGIDSGHTQQFLYHQQKDWNANSEIAALTDTTFLVVERDGEFPTSDTGSQQQAQKHLYKVDISGATNVSGMNFDSLDGLMVNNRTLEEHTWEELRAFGIAPVSKTLVADIVVEVAASGSSYPHDKTEGLWVISADLLGVINDDDFAVTADEEGRLVATVLPMTGQLDEASLYVLRIDPPLY
ncbi:unnamed protein product [Vitrella brassicaformis CCMP3155]|uniref:Phytase-like domain-containing protein n=1 Tax=Vitrella brassicaformis (strain CCMP3155) TaxID=1169540 RepID=A0A0G4GGY2_VITBC|nr:unnamed protein product [Vitrella brassicaformis CCMP3155]|eukprot:CEM28877.1 unnamed protein product [Vitrella brassicaformis CCMP3155]